jgi:hypothetical protein
VRAGSLCRAIIVGDEFRVAARSHRHRHPDQARATARSIARQGDEGLIAALCRGDERAFATRVDCHSPAMVRVARAFVPTRAAAEEAVQETWIAVMRGIEGFEGRSSLKT